MVPGLSKLEFGREAALNIDVFSARQSDADGELLRIGETLIRRGGDLDENDGAVEVVAFVVPGLAEAYGVHCSCTLASA